MVFTTTSDSDLMRLAPLNGVRNLVIFSADTLPRRKKVPSSVAGIVNQDDLESGRGGTHWVAYYNSPDRNHVMYYDSFGMPPDPRLLKYLKTSGKRVMGISSQQQDINSQACGQFAIHFLSEMTKGTSVGTYLSRFGTDEKKNEQLLKKWLRR
jgi:hypothetical protein